MVARARMVLANGLEFGLLEAGTGPLALCLHGFPDSAHTWRQLLPALAEAGFHAAAPFLRGYAPTAVPADGRYGIDALAGDAVALHQVMDGDGDAVLIGHDWGAETAYAAAAFAPGRWRRVVTLGVPPPGLDRLWQDWSPGFDGSEVLEQAKESMRQPANLAAAISYYRDAPRSCCLRAHR
jgi:pimeloyl-ACP methyl ester carboxylesterase